jgi:general nucleoside transport system ATP-binding protein
MQSVEPSDTPVVQLRGVTKRFGPVVACADVHLSVGAGQIHGLLGQNGAGKSTVAKMLVGLYTPDAGDILLDGQRVELREFADSIRLGVGMVHQHFSLVEQLLVWENVALGERGRVVRDRVCDEVRDIGRRYGLDVDPLAPVGDLSFGQRQRVEIVKCLRREPRTMILDEPTSSLSGAESAELFEVLRHVVLDRGGSVILISHKLDEIMRATDEVTVMRSGRVVASLPTSATGPRELAQLVVGRDVSLRNEAAALGLIDQHSEQSQRAQGPILLSVHQATARDSEGRVLLDGLDLEVRGGEVLGVFGVEGNGQSALGEVLASLRRLEQGTVRVDDHEVPTGRAGAMTNAGVAIITEDRHRSGCVLGMSVAENLVMGRLGGVRGRAGWLKRKDLVARAEHLIEEFGVSTASVDAPMWSLSGGNQQRVVLARELAADPVVLVAAQPTVGLDVGAIEFVGDRLREAAQRGLAVMLISTDLEEVLSLSTRIAVIHRGRIVGTLDEAPFDLERLGLLVGGETA